MDRLSLDDARSELQDLLVGPPSVFRFDVIRSLIDVWPASSRRTALRETAKGLRRWPTLTRLASADCSRLLALLKAPSWPLVRSLRLELYGDDATAAMLAMIRDPHASRIRSLEIQAADSETLQAFNPGRDLRRLARLYVGFPHDLTLPDLLAFLERLPKGVRSLDLGSVDYEMKPILIDRIAKSDELTRLVHFDPGYMSRADFEGFLKRWRAPLAFLRLSDCSPKILDLLHENEALARGIRRLKIPQSTLDDDGLAQLVRCPNLAGVESLELRMNEIGPRGVATLGRASFATNLRRLSLYHNPLGDEGWRRLASQNLPSLRDLDLSWTNGGPTGAAALARSRGLPRLRKLNLWRNQIHDEGVTSLCSARFARRLTSLWLAGVGHAPSAAETLAFRDWPNLRKFGFSGFGVNPDEYVRLARYADFPKLENLDLSGAGGGDEMAGAVAASKAFPRLRRLNLSHNQITDAGARSIAEGPALSGLNELNLNGNPISDEGFFALAASPWLRRLVFADFHCNDVTEGAIALASSPIVARLHQVTPPLNMEAITALKTSRILRPECRANPIFEYEA